MYNNLQLLHRYQTKGFISYLQPYFHPKFDLPNAKEKWWISVQKSIRKLETPSVNPLKKVHTKTYNYITTYNYYIGIKRKVSSHIYNPISSPSLIRQRPEKSDKSLCRKPERSYGKKFWICWCAFSGVDLQWCGSVLVIHSLLLLSLLVLCGQWCY